MTQLPDTSGNALADKRFELAQMFIERRDLEAAADLMRQALDLAPDWAECQFTLAETLMLMGQNAPAVEIFRTYLKRDPTDSMGAHAKLVILGAASATAELPAAYVERLFDQYAPRFEKSLVEGLKYSAPEHIRAALGQRYPERRFAAALDLGCGTGLMGVAIRPMADRLEGVDLSDGMLAQAKRKNVYDTLAHLDMSAALSGKAAVYDLILAADVFVYAGDLAGVTNYAHAALTSNGVVAFTVQALPDGDYQLGHDQRFSHSESYIRRVLSAFASVSVTPGTFRRDRDKDVPGLLVLAEKL
ncbi:MAG: methyltransferase domain-containing protein [Rhodospirillaceae bacterium]|nr:methyltransferase domain-containing protein [Rhodospirillaceae bacterium]